MKQIKQFIQIKRIKLQRKSAKNFLINKIESEHGYFSEVKMWERSHKVMVGWEAKIDGKLEFLLLLKMIEKTNCKIGIE